MAGFTSDKRTAHKNRKGTYPRRTGNQMAEFTHESWDQMDPRDPAHLRSYGPQPMTPPLGPRPAPQTLQGDLRPGCPTGPASPTPSPSPPRARKRRSYAGGAGRAIPGRRPPAVPTAPAHRPTKFSSTELLPALWPPTTAICGRSRWQLWPMELKASCSLLTRGMSSSIPRLPMAPAAPGPSALRSLPVDDPQRPVPEASVPLLPACPGLGATPAPGPASRSPPHPVLRRHPTRATSRPGPGAAPKALFPHAIGPLRCHSGTRANENEAQAYG
ncbi:hypothetical protein AAY473_019240 [Plecturocebus cupreus]